VQNKQKRACATTAPHHQDNCQPTLKQLSHQYQENCHPKTTPLDHAIYKTIEIRIYKITITANNIPLKQFVQKKGLRNDAAVL